MQDVVIFGTSDYAANVGGYIRRSETLNLIGFTVDKPPTSSFQGWPLFDYRELVSSTATETLGMFSCIGYSTVRNRKLIFDRIKSDGFALPTIVCPNTFIGEGATLGENTIVMPGTVVECNAKIGANNTIWSNATICHDAHIGDHNFFAANTVTGGRARVGSACFIGFSAVILHHCRLADETLLGAGSLLTEDTEPHGQYVGSPARRVKTHRQTGIRIA